MRALQTPYRKAAVEPRDERVLQYLPLVKHVLGRLPLVLPPGLDRDDLFSVGVCGLIHAAETFDPHRGASFKTYAFTAVRGAILDELRRHDPVPRSWRDKLKELDRAAATLKERLGRDATYEEMAELLEIPVERVERDMLALRTVTLLSLEEGQGEEGDLRQILEAPAARDPADEAVFREDVERLAAAIGRLPDQERQVVVLYYREELLLKEIGDLIGVSESRVSQILTKATHRLRRLLRAEGGG